METNSWLSDMDWIHPYLPTMMYNIRRDVNISQCSSNPFPSFKYRKRSVSVPLVMIASRNRDMIFLSMGTVSAVVAENGWGLSDEGVLLDQKSLSELGITSSFRSSNYFPFALFQSFPNLWSWVHSLFRVLSRTWELMCSIYLNLCLWWFWVDNDVDRRELGKNTGAMTSHQHD